MGRAWTQMAVPLSLAYIPADLDRETEAEAQLGSLDAS